MGNWISKLLILTLCLLSFRLFAQQKKNLNTSEMYFKYKQTLTLEECLAENKRLKALFAANAQVIITDPFVTDEPRLNRVFLISYPNQKEIKSRIVTIFKSNLNLAYFEKVFENDFFYTPNDYSSSLQYNLSITKALNAWDVAKGDAKIVVAVVDDAVALNHPDLAANIWINTLEIAGNGIDDDGNGYIDDVNGWDAADMDNNPNPVAAANANYH